MNAWREQFRDYVLLADLLGLDDEAREREIDALAGIKPRAEESDGKSPEAG